MCFSNQNTLKISENVIALLFMSNIVLKWLQLKGESASLANMTPVWGAIRSGLKITTILFFIFILYLSIFLGKLVIYQDLKSTSKNFFKNCLKTFKISIVYKIWLKTLMKSNYIFSVKNCHNIRRKNLIDFFQIICTNNVVFF